MLRTRTRVLGAVSCGGMLVLSSLATIGQTPAQEPAAPNPSPEDQARIEKQLRDLEAQRAKIDAQIRDLRRQEGRRALRTFTEPGAVFALPDGGARAYTFSNGSQKLTPEQRKEVEQALDEARRALDKARKDLPPGTLLPAIPNLDDGFFYNLAPGAGRAFTFTNPMTEEQRAQLRADMEKFRAQMKANSADIRKQVEEARRQAQQWRSLAPGTPVLPALPAAPYPPTVTIPGVPAAPGAPGRAIRPRIVVPAAPGRSDDAELRDEIRQLREEVERLRDEVRRQRPGRTGSDDTTRRERFVEPFGSLRL